MGILAALAERGRTGRGRKVEVSMIESMIAFATEPLGKLFSTGRPLGFYARAAASQSFILTCADGLRIGLHLSSPAKFWEGLVAAIGAPQLLQKYADRGARVDRYDELARDLADIFSVHPRAHWLALLEAHDVRFAPEHRLQDLADDPQVRHQEIFYSIEHPTQGAVHAAHRPVRFDGDHRSDFLPPPTLGEHTREVLQEVGLAAEFIEKLAKEGVIA